MYWITHICGEAREGSLVALLSIMLVFLERLYPLMVHEINLIKFMCYWDIKRSSCSMTARPCISNYHHSNLNKLQAYLSLLSTAFLWVSLDFVY